MLPMQQWPAPTQRAVHEAAAAAEAVRAKSKSAASARKVVRDIAAGRIEEERTTSIVTLQRVARLGVATRWRAPVLRRRRRCARERARARTMGPEPDERELREGRRGTPLHVAAWMGDAAKVAELIRAGGAAALEARSKNGSTPLHWVSARVRVR